MTIFLCILVLASLDNRPRFSWVKRRDIDPSRVTSRAAFVAASTIPWMIVTLGLAVTAVWTWIQP